MLDRLICDSLNSDLDIRVGNIRKASTNWSGYGCVPADSIHRFTTGSPGPDDQGLS